MNVIRKVIFIIIVGLILKLIFVSFLVAEEGKKSFILRIAIKRGVEEIELYIPGKTIALAPYSEKEIFTSQKSLHAIIKPTTYGLKLDKEEYKIFGLKFQPRDKKKFFINNIPYKGSVLILRTKDKKLMVINYISLSNYLRGVLYNEVSPWWPMATIKAQAVAARTYAIYKCRERADREYDMGSGAISQVYKGESSERFRTNLAIRKTKGKVLTYRGKVFPSFYHACCGGETEESENVWSIDLPVLSSIKDPFCKKAPYYNWRLVLSAEDLKQEFENSGYKIGKILNIAILERSSSGRIKKNFIVGEKDDFLITGEKFRSIVGYNLIKSTKFTIMKESSNYKFEGHGWGHGVGMCQWGAYYMGKAGYDYKHILTHYYSGAEIVNLRSQTSDYRHQTKN